MSEEEFRDRAIVILSGISGTLTGMAVGLMIIMFFVIIAAMKYSFST